MPVKECQINGESGYKWGDAGKCYIGPDAKAKAIAQGVAIGEFTKNDEFHKRISNVLNFVNDSPQVFEFKKWRSDPDSSNVDKIMFNDENDEMVIKFNDGSYYTYYNVDFNLFRDIFEGNGVCRTEGENQWGEWWVGKNPSVGAAVYEKLVLDGVPYRKGGSLR